MAAEAPQKYVLCLPRSGFNDMVKNIMKCIAYCKNYNRICVIDSKSNSCFGDDLNKYVDLTDTHIYNSTTEDFYKETATLRYTYYPVFLNCDNVDKLPLRYTTELGFTYLGQSVTFDFNKEYEEDVIVHSNCGRSIPISVVEFCNIFPFKQYVINELRKRWLTLDHPYLALHIRHTDYKSNVAKFLLSKKQLIDNATSIFVASDNKDIIEQMIEKYGYKIRSFSKINGTYDKPMHYGSSKISETHILDLLCDFLLLVVADEYHFSCIRSSYSTNAERLRASPLRARLIAQLAAPSEST